MKIRDIRDIGYNSEVSFGGRKLHVQTEIVGREPTIRTTVLDGGAILHAASTRFQLAAEIDACRVFVERVHTSYVSRAQSGEFS